MFTVRLEASDRPALHAHLLALDAEDRRLRFGYAARDGSIAGYVENIDFERDGLFGVQGDNGGFDGIIHLACADRHAEIGVSVLEHARGHGIGSALVSRAALHARNRGIRMLFMQCLSENRAIMRIARALGMQVVTEGNDSEATLALPEAPHRAIAIVREAAANPIALCDAALRDVLLPQAHDAVPGERRALG